MPQLRNASTGALIAEHSDPVDLANVAREVGLHLVTFDGVGVGFQVEVALEAADARLAAAADSGAEEREAAQRRVAMLEGPVAQAVRALIDSDDPDPTPVDIGDGPEP